MSFFSEVEKNIEGKFRKLTERVFGPASSGEPLLVHRAILEEVESKIQTVSRGRRIFPYNHLRVRLASPDPALEQEVRELLQGAGCEIPIGFSVVIETAVPGPRGFEIDYETAVVARKTSPAALTVVRGKANAESFLLDRARTNIGRRAELTDSLQRVIRRNDVVFEEGVDEANATVSRGHAHILRNSEATEYRICDESSEYGTRIFRDGRSIVVAPGSTRGERLRSGDEIYLGRACLRFEM
jgi:hypothetical protein